MQYIHIEAQHRERINAWIRKQWYTTVMVIRGQEVDMSKARGIFAEEDGCIVGLVTYAICDGVIEILSLDSLREGQGIGSRLLEMALEQGRAQGCGKAVLITTNDNLKAMGFYQRRGFDMARLYRNAVDAARSIKPEIPTVGEDGIPLRHEIEFEKIL